MAITAGTKLGRYEIRSKIGEGGMVVVYRTRDTKLNRDVAVLPVAFSADVDRLRRFEQEAQAASALNHPNILSIPARNGASPLPGVPARAGAATGRSYFFWLRDKSVMSVAVQGGTKVEFWTPAPLFRIDSIVNDSFDVTLTASASSPSAARPKRRPRRSPSSSTGPRTLNAKS